MKRLVAFVCLFVYLSVSNVTYTKKTTDHTFMKILPDVSVVQGRILYILEVIRVWTRT